MNPAAGMVNKNVNQYPISRLRYARYHNTKNGMTELNTCHKLRHVSGWAYCETMLCHFIFPLFGLSLVFII